jgi:uncharacterized iron-regulated membrane protein
VETLIQRVRDAEHAVPSTLTLRSDPDAPAEAGFGRERSLFVNPYTGQILGEGSKTVREFFRGVENWHRWLAVSAKNRATGRAITGAANLVFLGLVLSGMYLWLPKKWNWQHVKPVLLFRGGLSGKARDFNWHNVIGIWSAVPLFLIVLSGVVMSYPWANNLLYTMTGSEPPASGQRPGGPGGSPPLNLPLEGMEAIWTRAEQQVPDWKTISLRLPPSGAAPLVFTIDTGNAGQPQKRSTLTLSRQNGDVVRNETFASFNTGRRLRSYARFGHTGEVGGLIGQTIAGLASAGGAILVWTGIALAWRRFRAWQNRRSGAGRESFSGRSRESVLQ